MKVIYAGEKFPNSFFSSIFLVGPTPRSKEVPSWRPQALEYLEQAGYKGVVFDPEPRGGEWSPDYTGQFDWEDQGLNLADCIMVWLPREIKTMPAFTTNVEYGKWMESGKVIFGAPKGAPKTDYLIEWAKRLNIPTFSGLADTVFAALVMVGEGASRTGGERYIPLHIWKTPHFQSWYKAQVGAGNRLDWAKPVWTFRVGPRGNFVFFIGLHVDMYITSEDRHKTNEVMLTRPDIATVLLYEKGKAFWDTKIVLVREFRVSASNETGFVWEIPGGSSFKPTTDPYALMAEECHEEVGLEVDPSRVKKHQSREINPTMSAHKAHLFSVELTSDEMRQMHQMEAEQTVYGVEADTERTYVHVQSLKQIQDQSLVSWSMLGMILSVLSEEFAGSIR